MASERGRRSRPVWLLRPTLGEGGADRVTLILLRELDRRRFAPSLVLMRRQGALLTEVPVDVPIVSLDAASLWSAWRPLAGLLRRRPPAILFSTSSGTNLAALVARRLAPGPYAVVLSERGLLFRGRYDPKRIALFLLKRLLYRQADVITAVSEGVRQDLSRRLRLDPARIRVVHNPIVSAELEELAAAALEHPWCGGAEPLVLAAGRLVAEKDHATLLDAFARLRARLPARLLILGEGPLRPALERRVRALGLEESVQLPGFDPNPFRYMARCDLFVLSSAFEGLPGVLIQAMACGAAVIATDCPGGPAEIVRPDYDGLLTPVGDPSTLAETMLSLLEDPERRARLGERARRSAQRFGVAAALRNYTEALLAAELR